MVYRISGIDLLDDANAATDLPKLRVFRAHSARSIGLGLLPFQPTLAGSHPTADPARRGVAEGSQQWLVPAAHGEGEPKSMTKQLMTPTLPRISEICDGRIVIDIEPGLSILFTRDGDLCKVEIALSRNGAERLQKKVA